MNYTQNIRKVRKGVRYMRKNRGDYGEYECVVWLEWPYRSRCITDIVAFRSDKTTVKNWVRKHSGRRIVKFFAENMYD
jgi:hypothetical protein